MTLVGNPGTLPLSQTLPISKITRPVGAPKSRFNSFYLENTRVLNDDYVHKKFLTVKYTGKGQSFLLNSKGTLDFKVGADKREVPVTSSEVKFITNIEGRNLEAKFDNRGGIRLWGNFGTYSIGRPTILTAKVKTNTAFSALSGNVAFEYAGSQSNVSARFDLKNGNIPYFSNRILFNYDKLQLGYAAKLNLAAYTVARYNLFASYRERDLTILAEHSSRNKTKLEFGKLVVAAIYRRAGNDYALKTSYRPYKAEQVRVKVGVLTSLNKNTVVKAKINNNTKLTLSGKFKQSSNLSIVAGTQVNLLDPSTFFTNKTVPIPLGLSFEFAYN